MKTTLSCLPFEFARREPRAAEPLTHGHLQLRGLDFPVYVGARWGGGGQRESYAPDRGNLFLVAGGCE